MIKVVCAMKSSLKSNKETYESVGLASVRHGFVVVVFCYSLKPHLASRLNDILIFCKVVSLQWLD